MSRLDRMTATPAPLIPIAPIGAAPQPTPRPTPGGPGSPPPDEEPLPTTPVGGGGSCSDPRPPAVSRMDVVIHIYGANRLILDATPLVGPNGAYCKLIGFTDGRRFCPTRPEGHPERFACDAMVVGNAADTGRAGPTWRANGGPCGGRPWPAVSAPRGGRRARALATLPPSARRDLARRRREPRSRLPRPL